MITMSIEEFKNRTFTKSRLIKEYKNGSSDYMVECACPRCSGRGFITFSSVDNSRCWQCNETGKVSTKIKVIPDEIIEAKREIAQQKFQAALDARKEQHIQAGYKPIDWKFADWFYDCNKNCGWKYYLIKRETEKAVLVSLLVELENSEYEIWMPKKAMVK